MTLVAFDICTARSLAFRMFSYRFLSVSSFNGSILKSPKKRLVLLGFRKKAHIFKLLWKLSKFECIFSIYYNTKIFEVFVVVIHPNNSALDAANKFNWGIVEVFSNIKRYATRASLRLFSSIGFNGLIALEFVF